MNQGVTVADSGLGPNCDGSLRAHKHQPTNLNELKQRCCEAVRFLCDDVKQSLKKQKDYFKEGVDFFKLCPDS